MNPVLPLLALLAVGGVLVRGHRGGLGIPWTACGLAALALLTPALSLRDGVPSPAASLAADPPWQSVARPADGNPILSDVTYQVYPWLLFLRDEVRAGRLPFWNPFQYSGTPFWGNGSGAPVFPLHLLFVVLPLRVGFLLLPFLRIVAGGCGAWALARELGLGRPAALLTALTFPLSGMLVGFVLYPMGNALALVPWVLLAVERIAARRAGFAPLAVATGLQLLAGHPETALHTALLCGIYLLVRGGGLAAWLRLAAGWAVGAAVAAVDLAPLAATLFDSSRWQQWQPTAAAPPFALLALQPLRLVLPEMYGNPALGTWWGPFNFLATAVYAGALALPLAAAGILRSRGDRRWLAVVALLVFSLAGAYQLPGVRDVLLALPLIGRVLHHRLIFGVELSLALLAGAGCEYWLAGRGRAVAVGAAAVGALLATAWMLLGGDWVLHGTTATQLRWTLWVGAVALLLAASLLVGRERRWTLYPLLPALLVVDLVAAHGRINPAQPLSQLYPRTGAVRFLAGRSERSDRIDRIAALGNALRPNAAMVYRLYDARGDDSVKLQRYEALYAAHLGEGHPTYFRPLDRWDDPWLDRLGVRWVLGGPRQEPPASSGGGWRLAYAGSDARVWERLGALPLVRWLGEPTAGSEQLAVRRREPGRWVIDWQSPRRRVLIVAEAWDRGWRALVDGGASLPVVAAGDALLGVRLGPGRGRLVLRQVPVGVGPGAVLSLLGLAATAVGLAVGRRTSSSVEVSAEDSAMGETA